MVSGSIILNLKSSVIPLIVKRIAKEQTSGKVKSDRSSYSVICFVCSCGNYEKTAQNHQGMATIQPTEKRESECVAAYIVSKAQRILKKSSLATFWPIRGGWGESGTLQMQMNATPKLQAR